MCNSTLTPSPTSMRIAFPLAPESRLGVRWSFTVYSSLAKALLPRTSDANNVAPNTMLTPLFSRSTILLFATRLHSKHPCPANAPSYCDTLTARAPSIVL